MKARSPRRFLALTLSPRRGLGALLLLAALVLLPACNATKPPPAGRSDLLPIESYPKIVATDRLHKALRFSQPIVTPSTDTTPMSVVVPVRLIKDRHAVNLQYEFEFYDARGAALGPAGWQYIKLEPRVQDQMAANALSTEAYDWRLTVRSAR